MTDITKKNSTCRPVQRCHYLPRATLVAVLSEIDALPSPQCQTPRAYRQAQLAAEQAGLEVCRQVVRPFVVMLVTVLALRHQTIEEPFEITPYR